MSNTYLSIDLDYYTGLDYSSADRYKCFDLVNKALELRVPTIVVDTHHGLTDHINNLGKKMDIDHLINIDFHDDIVREGEWGLCEGSWVTHIDWKGDGVYEWRYPSYEKCIDLRGGVCDRWTDLFDNPDRAGWYDCVREEGLEGINWSDVKALGICMSGFWLYDYAMTERNFGWNKPYYRRDYEDLEKMYGKSLCMLTGKKTFDEAFWFVQSSYTYTPGGFGTIRCKHFWSKYLSAKRNKPWTNPVIRYNDDRSILMRRFQSKLKKHGTVSRVEI